MSQIYDIANSVIALIGIGAGLKCIILGINIAQDPDNKDIYLKKLKKTIIVFIISLSTFSIKLLVNIYYGWKENYGKRKIIYATRFKYK